MNISSKHKFEYIQLFFKLLSFFFFLDKEPKKNNLHGEVWFHFIASTFIMQSKVHILNTLIHLFNTYS